MKGFFIKFIGNDVYTNMAIDEYLYLYVDEPVIRFYNFNKPSLTIGYNQRYGRSCNTDFIEKNGMDLTRRITGGRTVFHCGDLTYSFSSSYKYFSEKINGKNNLLERYKKLSEAFIKGFNLSGIDVDLKNNESETPYGANCFSSTSIYEITMNNEKILGSAQTFKDDRFLQQGSILVNNCPIDSNKIFGSNTKIKNIEKISSIVYNIKELSDNFYEAFFSILDFNWHEYNIDMNSKKFLELIYKYKKSDWIMRR